MTALVGTRGQQVYDRVYDASGTITAGGTAQLVLAESKQRSFLLFQNLSAGPMYIEFGSARATATLTAGVVTALTITNAGFGFTLPPIVEFLGGGNPTNSTFLGCGQYGYDAPSQIARVQTVLTGGAVSSFLLNDGGAKYSSVPYVRIRNQINDPFGCAAPSATSGILINAGDPPLILNGTICTTDPLAVFAPSTGQAFTCKWMP